MRLTPQALAQYLTKNSATPLYLLHGNESFLVEESAALIRRHIQSLGMSEHTVLNQTDDSLVTHVEQPSLFVTTQIIELKIAKPSATTMAPLLSVLAKPLVDCFLIIQTGMISRQQQQAKWYTQLEQKGVTIAHWPLTGYQFSAWIEERATQKGLTLSPALKQQLIAYTEGNCLAAAQEIDRLRLTDGETYFVEQSQYALSELCEAALAKQPARVVKIVSYLKNSKEALQLVIWSLGQTLRALNRCANAPREHQSNLLQQGGIRPQLHPLYFKALQDSPSTSWLSLLTGLSSADKHLKSGNETSAWQVVLDISLQLSGQGVFSTLFADD